METEEFWNAAVDFVLGVNGLRENSIDWDPERLVNSMKTLDAVLPKTFTRENPYQLNLNGDLHCNFWYQDAELVCGEYYYLHRFPRECTFKRHQTKLVNNFLSY